METLIFLQKTDEHFTERVKVLGKRTEFEKDQSQLFVAITSIRSSILLLEVHLSDNERIPDNIWNLNSISTALDQMHSFLLKHNDFFRVVDKKFGTHTMKFSESSMRAISDMRNQLDQMLIFLSQNKSKAAKEIFKNFVSNWKSLIDQLSGISILPQKIDYSKLSNKDWRMIGVAGIHYKSKVFLSYFFRDADPKKDENQKMIDYYVKPTLDLLDIEPVTAREYLKPQELINDRIVELIEDCDGIVGFYTKGDSVENVEHELSRNPNIVAICKEEGAKVPSMRLSRLLINFRRDQMGDFCMHACN